MIIAPSLLAANWKKINQELTDIKHPNVKWIHFDVMDGKFVAAKTYTPEQLRNISLFASEYFFDVHLMVSDPIKQATLYAQNGGNLITFHFEATKHHDKVIKHIKSLGCKVGISIKPNTPSEVLMPYLEDIDVVLIMSVEPGKGGQAFIDDSLNKIIYFSKLKKKYNFLIEVDGGIKGHNARSVIDAGADVLVAGSYIFNSPDYKKQINSLLKK